VTGLSLITALGNDAEASWQNIQAGVCGITDDVTIIPVETLGSKVASQIHDMTFIDNKIVADTPEDEATPLDRCHELAYHGVKQALEDAGLIDQATRPYASERIGITVGTLLGGQRRGEVFHRHMINHGLAGINTKMVTQQPAHTVADYVAREFGLMGPRTVPCNACAASAVAIAYGKELLESGKADMVVAGGAEPLAYMASGGFSCLEALDPQPCAPYSRSHGLSLGEGSAFLILERREDAEARGAKILAVIAGYGFSADAHHPTQPEPSGDGAAQCIRSALDMAGLDPAQIGYINGHGTGTPANDTSEPRAMRTVFGTPPPPMSSTKSIVGHTLGAAGAVEAAVTILGLRDQLLPPTIVPPDATPQEGLDIIPNKARPAEFEAAVSTSFAFGGNNACLAIARPHVKTKPAPALREVVITGVGAIAAQARNAKEMKAAVSKGERIYGPDTMEVANLGSFPMARVPVKHTSGGIDPNYVRRMDPLSKRAELPVNELLRQRRLPFADLKSTGLFFATYMGPLSSIEQFEEGMLVNGQGQAKYFPNTVMNAAPGHVAKLHKLKGPTITVTCGVSGVIASLWMAHRMIARGEADRIIVAAADEITEPMVYTYAERQDYLTPDVCRPFLESGRLLGDGGAAIMLEAAETTPVERILGRVSGYGMCGDVSRDCQLSDDETAWARSFELALEEAGHDVDAVISAATGHRHVDLLETDAIRLAGLQDKPVFAPKGLTGDLSVVSPLVGIIWGLWLAGEDLVDPAGYGYYDGFGPIQGKINSALVSSYDVGGNYHSVVVSGV